MRAVPLVLVVLAACGAAAPVRPPDPTVPARARFDAASERHERLLAAIDQEDAPRDGEVARTSTVRGQLAAVLGAADRARSAAVRLVPADVAAYVRAVDALARAYLGSVIESTDGPRRPLPFRRDDTRDELGSLTVDEKLHNWQPAAEPLAFIKFAIPPPPPGAPADAPLTVRVCRGDVRHIDIAGGPALAVGIMRFRFDGARPVVSVLENTSGGFRPGIPRLAIALTALARLGYLPARRADLTVYENPTGDYDRSMIAHSTR